MNTTRLIALAKKSPLVAGAFACGTGLTTTEVTSAALMTDELNRTVEAGETLYLDLSTFELTAVPDENTNFQISVGSDGLDAIILTKADAVFADSGNLIAFSENDTIDASSGNRLNFGFIYNGNTGTLPNVGDSAFFGLQVVHEGDLHYGFIEIERGSAILGQVGFETTPGAGAVIGTAAVPEPSALAMLAMGGAGLATLRRRRDAGSTVAS